MAHIPCPWSWGQRPMSLAGTWSRFGFWSTHTHTLTHTPLAPFLTHSQGSWQSGSSEAAMGRSRLAARAHASSWERLGGHCVHQGHQFQGPLRVPQWAKLLLCIGKTRAGHGGAAAACPGKLLPSAKPEQQLHPLPSHRLEGPYPATSFWRQRSRWLMQGDIRPLALRTETRTHSGKGGREGGSHTHSTSEWSA